MLSTNKYDPKDKDKKMKESIKQLYHRFQCFLYIKNSGIYTESPLKCRLPKPDCDCNFLLWLQADFYERIQLTVLHDQFIVPEVKACS